MGERPRGHVLIAGVTTRALATSAAKAGYTVTAIDAFGDRDLQSIARVIVPCGRPGQRYGPLQAAAAGAEVPAELVAYTSNFENCPSAVARLAQHRQLLGNPPRVLEKVRNPVELMRTLRHHGVASPISRLTAPAVHPSLRWMLKPRRSGGGHGVQAWRTGTAIPRTMYLQQRISGPSGSIVFASSNQRAVVLGLSRQLVGDPRLGAGGFRYCGSLLAGADLFHRQAELLERATHLATVVTREFRLVGLNGIDFIACDGIPYPTEVNPRFSASMELIERGQGISMFGIHARACQGTLPSPRAPTGMVQGKAIVFARRSLTINGSYLWEAGRDLADLPQEGERIPRGSPICTVFAEAPTAEDCHELLLRKAATIYRATGRQLRHAS
jgi:uncharacterized protein